MNKRGTLGIAIMTSLFILIVGMMSVNFLMPEITNARASLNCSNADQIRDGVKLFCLVTDATIPYFIIIILSLVIGGITAKFNL